MTTKGKRQQIMSRFHFKLPEKLRRISAVSGGSSGPPTPKARGRRAAFSAVHFKKEKIMKQLQTGIEKGDTSQVEDVVEIVDIAELEEGNLSFVRRACELGNLDIVAVLLRNGASVNLIGEGNCAPIHVAARMGNSALTAILLSNSANPHSQAKYEKKTPLHVATLEGHIEVIRLLIANGADVNVGDIYGSRPLHIASRMARVQILQTLLDSHARIDTYDNEGWTALHLAAEAGHENIVKMLLDNNANVDSQSKYGRTPLHWACVSGHVSVVHTLLQRGASANIRDLHEHLPLYYAKNDAVKTLVQMHTEKPSKQKFASSIGLYINSKAADQASILSASPTLGDTKVRRWMSSDPLAESRRTSSSLDEDITGSCTSIPSKRTSHRYKQNKAPVTIIIHSDNEDIAEETETEFTSGPIKQEKPSLSTSFVKMVGTVNGHMDDLDTSVTELGAILKLASEGSIEFNLDSVKEYVTKIGNISGKLKLLKNNFSTESQNVKNIICDYTIGGKMLESGNPSYISLVQLLVECICAHVGQFEEGWSRLLYRLPIPEEHSGILSFQMKMKSVPDSEKVNQIIMHWARGCDNEDKVLYMRTLLQAIQKCEFVTSDTDHVDRILEQLINLQTNFKTGNSESTSSRLSHLVSSLPDKDVRQLHHQITASTANLNVFPTLDELSVSESDNEAPVKSLSNKDVSVRSINDKLEQLLRDVVEEEDLQKLVAALKHLIMSGREDLVTCIL